MGKLSIAVEETIITCDVKRIPVWDKDIGDMVTRTEHSSGRHRIRELTVGLVIFLEISDTNFTDKKNHAQDTSLRHHCQP